MADALPCPKCNRKVEVYVSYGGIPNTASAYKVSCKCGLEVDELGFSTKRSGIAAWNKYVKQYAAASTSTKIKEHK